VFILIGLTSFRGQDLLLLAAGAWGLSALLHELASVLAMFSDNLKAEIIVKASGRRR